jgi:hypothetical protein
MAPGGRFAAGRHRLECPWTVRRICRPGTDRGLCGRLSMGVAEASGLLGHRDGPVGFHPGAGWPQGASMADWLRHLALLSSVAAPRSRQPPTAVHDRAGPRSCASGLPTSRDVLNSHSGSANRKVLDASRRTSSPRSYCSAPYTGAAGRSPRPRPYCHREGRDRPANGQLSRVGIPSSCAWAVGGVVRLLPPSLGPQPPC